MAEPIGVLTVEPDGEDGLIVTFSDGTTAGYVAEELLELRPFREPTAASRLHTASDPARKRNTMSAAGRGRIAAAQKKKK
jgi:hypothetical protein